MSKLPDLCVILLTNILNSDQLDLQDIQSLEQSFSDLKEVLDIESGIRIAHLIGKHAGNVEFKIDDCNQSHCLLCLEFYIDRAECQHNCRLTQFEIQNLTHQLNVFKHLDDLKFKVRHFRCRVCQSEPNEIKKSMSDCPCKICVICRHSNYLNRNASCQNCNREYTDSEMINIYSELKSINPDAKQLFKCLKCGFVFDDLVFQNAEFKCAHRICSLCRVDLNNCTECDKIPKEDH